MQLKTEQLIQQLALVNTDYTNIIDNEIVSLIQKTVHNSSNSWSDTCHSDVHSDNDHFDSHTDTHPDCANSGEWLGDY